MAAVTGSEGRDGMVAFRRRTLVLAVVMTLGAACSSTAASETPATTGPTTTAPVPVPATAEITGGALDAPHSGDRPVSAGCPADAEMLDWDDDGWGDCVNPGAPARPALPTPGG